MLSKVIGRAGGEGFRAIAWSRPGDQETTPTPLPTGAEEMTALRQKIAALESQNARAHSSGFQEGQSSVGEMVNGESAPLIERLARSVQDLADMKPRLRREAESDVVQLAIAIARRILHRELSVDPAAMRALVQVALERLDRQEIYRVHVHPGQLDTVRSFLQERGARVVEVVSAPGSEPGMLVFETNRGKLDASAHKQLDEIERGLTDRVNRA